MPRHVTAGVDSSPESLAAAHWAAREAALRDARLLLVHVEEWPLPLAVAAPTIDRDDHRRWAHRLLDAAAAEVRVRHPDAEVTTRLLSGRPPAALAVEAAGSELLVLGSRGLDTVAGALMGSVGTAVIGATEVPVVVVRAG
ncbi:universal stress protein [Streptomyces zhihengii]|uniref:universal stress protein n=1 Tax=Streptomyces zhihengii TaxID=1818004 RepID=UPI003675E07A